MPNFTLLTALFTLLFLTGCVSDSEKPESVAPVVQSPAPTVIQAKIIVSKQANPDVNGRPSPIVMRIYELKNLGKFEAADFYKLFQEYESVLGSDLIASEQFHLKPGDTKIVEYTTALETKFIAVAAAYRDINQAVWRYYIPINAARTSHLEILLDRLSISIKKKELEANQQSR